MNEHAPACIPCGIRSFRRNTYFNGKLLVERDFTDEQAYLIGKEWLHNNLLHGVGTVCGLKVLAHPNPECQDQYLYIEPGVALDCCGREIIVTEKLLVPVQELIDANEVEVDDGGSTDLFIGLCYQELNEEQIPVILPDCDCADGNQAYNRIREGYKLHLFSQPAGARQPVRPSMRAKLDWEHTISLSQQSPRALAVDNQLQQLYVAAQMLPEEDALGARLYAFRTDTHDLITAVSGGRNPTDLALSLLGDLIFLASDDLLALPVQPSLGSDHLQASTQAHKVTVAEETDLTENISTDMNAGNTTLALTDTAFSGLVEGDVLRIQDTGDPGLTEYVSIKTSGTADIAQPGLRFNHPQLSTEVHRVTVTLGEDLTASITGDMHVGDSTLALDQAAISALREGDILLLEEPGNPALTEYVTVQGNAGIAVFRESDIRNNTQPAAIINLGKAARLAVSPFNGALFALIPESGELRAWSEESIRAWLDQPDPSPAGPTPMHRVTEVYTTTSQAAFQGGAVLSVTLNGRYCFIVDSDNADPNRRLRAIDVAQLFSNNPDAEIPLTTDEQDRPISLATSRDSVYLYVLWEGQGGHAGNALLTRYQLLTDEATAPLILHRDGVGGMWVTEPRDLALAPDERWAYVLQDDSEQSQVQVISIDAIASPVQSSETVLLGTRENISGTAHFERLAVLGGRLYVASDDEATDRQPERGLIAILDVEEAACDDLFLRAMDGCSTCNENDDNSRCVVLAHIPDYQQGMPIKNADEAGEEDNHIDNLTHRPLVPNTNNIVEVIRCMLEQGLAEGIPGPRGPAGEEGPTGPRGERGPGLVEEVLTTTLEPGQPASASLTPVPGDPEGDFQLSLALPRGSGIIDVDVIAVGPDDPASAELVDQHLTLSIPRGQPGVVEEPVLTHINGLSWLHGSSVTFDDFRTLMVDSDFSSPGERSEGMGLVISFDRAVDLNTVFHETDPQAANRDFQSEVFQLFVRVPVRENDLYQEFLVPRASYQAVQVNNIDDQGLITQITPLPDVMEAEAVRLVFEPDFYPALFEELQVVLRIVFRSDFALDTENRAVDGNHLGGSLPTGNGREGSLFESWLNLGELRG
jgi:hypothetical protein